MKLEKKGNATVFLPARAKENLRDPEPTSEEPHGSKMTSRQIFEVRSAP
jgi:hypothetical protein